MIIECENGMEERKEVEAWRDCERADWLLGYAMRKCRPSTGDPSGENRMAAAEPTWAAWAVWTAEAAVKAIEAAAHKTMCEVIRREIKVVRQGRKKGGLR